LEQLSKAINENNSADSMTNLLEILPNYNKSHPVVPFFTIYYATQSNTSKKFADKIADDSKILNIPCQVKNISEISLEDFNKNVMMLFFISTYGEGGPSDDCIEFNKLLESKSRGKNTFFEDVTNQDLHYAVFGLGSSKYEYFCEMGKKFDAIFSKNGMKRICELGTGDDSKNINQDFENWRKNFWMESQKYFTENHEKIKKISEEKNLKELYEGAKDEIEIILGNKFNSSESSEETPSQIDINEYDFNIKRFLQSDQSTIEDITELRKENINGSTLKITYSLENTNVKYNAGDNIGIYPTNSEASVNTVLSRLNYDGEQNVNIKKLKEGSLKKKVPIINGYTIKELLTNLVDLSCQVNKELLEKFLKFCYDEDEYNALQNILKRENKLNEFLAKNYNIVDFLTAYESINLPFIEFYNLMPKITPRFYTVASSPNFRKNKLEIIISLVEWKGANNSKRYGLTSNYYKRIFDNRDSITGGKQLISTRLIVRESSFKLPKNPSQPLIMICTGTGIAPFISFFQEFHYHLSENGHVSSNINHNVLIFGSKNKQYDFIYEEEIEEYSKKSIIKQVYTAFSRDQESKFYVQDIINHKKSELEDMIINQESIVYVCGGVSMGAEVVNILEKHFTKEHLKKMEAENRLIKELWG
jgi:NADPH-ferrihemoprotein reductase